MREFVFEIDSEVLRDLEGYLFDLNPLGYVVENERGVERVRVYDEKIVGFLKDAGFDPIEIFESTPEDWYGKQLKDPFELVEGVVVDPSGTYSGGGIVLRIEPGAAFGTGLHPTTKLCAGLLKKHLRPGDDVLDVGTGTGILAILAKKLGAERVVGIDNDPLAIESAVENAELSGVEAEFLQSDLLEKVEGKFDLVVANIVPGVLIRLSEEIPRILKDDSIVIMSGIEKSSANDVRRAYSWMEIVEEATEGDWIALTLRSSRGS